MFFPRKDKTPSGLIGLYQALVVMAYCVLVVSTMRIFKEGSPYVPEAWLGVMMLMTLVFSAALMAVTVFGFPLYFIIEKDIKKAISVVAFTFLWLVIGFSLLALLAFLL